MLGTGDDGICNVDRANAGLPQDFEQVIPQGQGDPNQLYFVAQRGANIATANDDKLLWGRVAVHTGDDGIRQTSMAGTDVNSNPAIAMGQGLPDAVCVDGGANGLATEANNQEPQPDVGDDTGAAGWINDGSTMALDNAGY